MAEIYVHYYVDGKFGTVDLHFSGARTFHAKISNTANFEMAVNAVKQIPIGKRNWNPKTFVWTLDSDKWNLVLPFYSVAPQLFELISYQFESQWLAFLANETVSSTDKKKIDPNAPDHVKAQGFFNNFNQVIEATASVKTDKEQLARLIGVDSFEELNRANAQALKSIYRATAIRLHPDKNSGNGEQMSRFTQLWGIYINGKH